MIDGDSYNNFSCKTISFCSQGVPVRIHFAENNFRVSTGLVLRFGN